MIGVVYPIGARGTTSTGFFHIESWEGREKLVSKPHRIPRGWQCGWGGLFWPSVESTRGALLNRAFIF